MEKIQSLKVGDRAIQYTDHHLDIDKIGTIIEIYDNETARIKYDNNFRE